MTFVQSFELPVKADACCSVPVPVQVIVTTPLAMVGALNFGCATTVRARYTFNPPTAVSAINTFVPSGLTVNHSQLAPPPP